MLLDVFFHLLSFSRAGGHLASFSGVPPKTLAYLSSLSNQLGTITEEKAHQPIWADAIHFSGSSRTLRFARPHWVIARLKLPLASA